MGHPDFRAGGRIFASLHANEETGTVKLTPDEQREIMRAASARTFTPRPRAHGGGKGGQSCNWTWADEAAVQRGAASGLAERDEQAASKADFCETRPPRNTQTPKLTRRSGALRRVRCVAAIGVAPSTVALAPGSRTSLGGQGRFAYVDVFPSFVNAITS